MSQAVHTAVAAAPVVQHVVVNHTVFVNQLSSVLGKVLVAAGGATALSVVHWVTLNDRLSKGQNKALATAYSLLVGLVATLSVNNWSIPIDLTSTGELVAFAAAALGAAQTAYNVITAKQPSRASVATPDSEIPTAEPSEV